MSDEDFWAAHQVAIATLKRNLERYLLAEDQRLGQAVLESKRIAYEQILNTAQECLAKARQRYEAGMKEVDHLDDCLGLRERYVQSLTTERETAEKFCNTLYTQAEKLLYS